MTRRPSFGVKPWRMVTKVITKQLPITDQGNNSRRTHHPKLYPGLPSDQVHDQLL